MYIYNNTCNVNNDCQSGFSLYFPCINTLTRGENACFDFYLIDNITKKEVDLREIDDITLNMSGRYNCSFGSFSYPEKIKSAQVEKFTDMVFDIDFSNIINQVKLYIDIVDENHNCIESFVFDRSLFLDINIEGSIGYFIKGSDKDGVLNLKGYDTHSYMFLGWNIEENDESCDLENIYDYLIKNSNLVYNIDDDCIIRAVYQKRREYTICMADDNYNSSFIVEYMGEKTTLREGDYIKALEGHDIKVSCIPNDIMPYKFDKWYDNHKNPYRVFKVSGEGSVMYLKAKCSLNVIDYIEYVDNIDANLLNNFNIKYPDIKDHIFVDEFFVGDIYINNCEIDVLNETPYIKIIDGGYIQILNISEIGNFKILLNNIGDDCKFYIDNHIILPSYINKNEFVFEFDGGIMTFTGNGSCLFGIKMNKEIIYDKGKCILCLNTEDTLKLHPGEIIVDGGVVFNGNPYGISPVKIANVTNIKPLILK